jgi:hypothetical protein
MAAAEQLKTPEIQQQERQSPFRLLNGRNLNRRQSQKEGTQSPSSRTFDLLPATMPDGLTKNESHFCEIEAISTIEYRLLAKADV